MSRVESAAARTSGYNPGTATGVAITRIGPGTNALSTSVPARFSNGFLTDSQGAPFYSEPQAGWYRLTTGSTTFDSLGTYAGEPIPAATGLWVESSGGNSAQYFTSAGTPLATVPIDGTLVAGETSVIYRRSLGQQPGRLLASAAVALPGRRLDANPDRRPANLQP